MVYLHTPIFYVEKTPPVCTCGAVFTVAHVFTECVDTAALRVRLGISGTLSHILRDDVKSADLVIRFLRESDLFRKF